MASIQRNRVGVLRHDGEQYAFGVLLARPLNDRADQRIA